MGVRDFAWRVALIGVIRWVVGLVLAGLCLVALAFTSWLVVFGCFSVASFALFAVIVFWPTGAISGRVWVMRIAMGVVWVVGIVAASDHLVGELDHRIQRLAAIPRSKEKLDGHSFRDKVGIYGLNLAMGAAAMPLYPEVSRETMLLALKPPADGVRVFTSDFPLGSARVREAVRAFGGRTPGAPDSLDRIWEKKVAWSLSEYAPGKPEARWALAMNPAQVRIRTLASEMHSKLHVSVEVRVEYPANCRVVLLGNPRLAVEEGLFWVLQQDGWLHPYTASWQFTLDQDDPRIAEVK